MSKAEKFIQDCTRNCSNELCAVEDRFGKKVISYHEWLTPDQAKEAMEIAREEIYEWLQENASKYTEKQNTIFGRIKVLNSHKLVNDLKQAMKNE